MKTINDLPNFRPAKPAPCTICERLKKASIPCSFQFLHMKCSRNCVSWLSYATDAKTCWTCSHIVIGLGCILNGAAIPAKIKLNNICDKWEEVKSK